MIKMGIWIILWIVLGIFSYWDLKEKSLPLRWLLPGIFGSAIYTLLRAAAGNNGIRGVIPGIVPGLLLIALALAAKGKLGCGDGLVLILIGNLMGVKICLLIFLAAVLLSFVYSCLLLTVFRKRRGYSFPFVPFYLLGAVIVRAVFI